jgi:hypothetical protein
MSLLTELIALPVTVAINIQLLRSQSSYKYLASTEPVVDSAESGATCRLPFFDSLRG